MKKLAITAFLILLSAAISFGQGMCTRHHEALGNFSYCPPSGWSPRDPKSGSYKSFVTADGSPVRGNFNLTTEATAVDHDAYMGAALRLLLAENEKKGLGATKLVGWTEFSTDSKIQGSRPVYETLRDGALLRTVQFVLDFPGKKLILTCTSLAADKDAADKIFDGVAKTIRLER